MAVRGDASGGFAHKLEKRYHDLGGVGRSIYVSLNGSSDGSSAYGTEVVDAFGFHGAIMIGAVDSLGLIPGPLKDPYRVVIGRIVGRGDRRIRINHVLPFAFKIDQGGDVLLVRFHG